MRKRTIVIAVALAAVFIGWTSWSKWGRGHLVANDGPWWTGPSTVQGAGLGSDEQNNIDIYKRAREATVNITSTVLQRNWFLEVFPVKESGSGIVIDKQGRILTNAHVVSGRAPSLEVTLAGGQKYKAERIYVDQANDMALIKINPKGELKSHALPCDVSGRQKVPPSAIPSVWMAH